MKTINKILIVILVFVSICTCIGNNSKKTELSDIYNPIGDDFGTVVEYVSNSGLQYYQNISDKGNILIMYLEKSDIERSDSILKVCYFDDDRICFRWSYSYRKTKSDSIISWLNQNFKKLPNKPEMWKDSKHSLIYGYVAHDEPETIELICIAENNLSEEVSGTTSRADYTHVSFYNPNTQEWSEWANVDHTFIFIEDREVIHYIDSGDGEKITYKSAHQNGYQGKTTHGDEYQIIKATDASQAFNFIFSSDYSDKEYFNKGEEFSFQIFKDSSIGLRLIFKNGFIVHFIAHDE